MGKAENYVTTLVNILSDIKQTYELNYQKVNDLDKETQDLEHQIELSTFSASEGYKLAKEIQRVRQERRIAKDENTTLFYLYEYFNKYPQIVKDLQGLKKNINREQEFMKNRLYSPRIRTDLTIPTLNNITDLQTKFKQEGAM